jgi:DtxR family Mn-dependent transcriptional regulator
MEAAEREDLLLAINRLKARSGFSPTAEAIAGLLQRSLSCVQSDMQELITYQEVGLAPDGTLYLTAIGEAAATAVMKKHKVLEAFFEEMLGMDREAAHQEACTLEHHASEETISRMSRFILTNPVCLIDPSEIYPDCECDVLADCPEGSRACVTMIKFCERSARLADFGLFPGEEVIIRRRMGKTLLVQVKGSNIAISAEIAKRIMVEPCK